MALRKQALYEVRQGQRNAINFRKVRFCDDADVLI
jgi:hypothetical protein